MRIKTILGATLTTATTIALLATPALAGSTPDWFERAAARGVGGTSKVVLAGRGAASPDWFERAVSRRAGDSSKSVLSVGATALPDWFERAAASDQD